MLSFTGSLKIYLAIEPVDLRKSFAGLSGVVELIMKEDVTSGALYVFTNKRKNRIKILYWDGTGLWVMIKRLEAGRFSWPKGVDVRDGKLALKAEALALLLDGIDMKDAKMKPWYQR